jgi:hypothetical protein
MLDVRPLLAAALLATPSLAAADSLFDPYVDVRWRLELMDQAGFDRTASASTLRVRGGVHAGPWHGFGATLEGEAITRLGPENFNDTVNGQTAFPVVADPSDILLNQAFVNWQDKAIGSASVGRQAVNLDNQRWVGSINWRQNDQTLDIVQAEVTAIKGVSFSYGQVWQVNRVFGPESPQGIWRNTNISLLHATANLNPVGRLVAYGYLLDIADSPASSSQSFGLRLTGSQPVGKATVLYAVEYARQSEYGPNPKTFSLDYALVESGLKVGAVTAKVGYERLEGNGRTGLQTPLATLHLFNGWADKFLVTPPDGLQDLYVDVAVAPVTKGAPKGLVLRAIYHDFRSTLGNVAYGEEFDFQIGFPVTPRVSLLAKAALYKAQGFAVDTTKLWLQAEARF